MAANAVEVLKIRSVDGMKSDKSYVSLLSLVADFIFFASLYAALFTEQQSLSQLAGSLADRSLQVGGHWAPAVAVCSSLGRRHNPHVLDSASTVYVISVGRLLLNLDIRWQLGN